MSTKTTSSAQINVKSWVRNAGKSVAFSSLNVLKSIAPNMGDTVVSASDNMRDVRNFIMNSRSNMRNQSRTLENSTFGKSVKDIYDSAINDIKTGNFSLAKAGEDAFGAFDDIDVGDLDFSGDSQSDSSNIDIGTAIIGRTLSAGNAASIDAMREMTNVIASTNIKSAKMMSTKQTDIALFGINKINSSIMGVNNRLDAINANLVSMIQFQNENVSVTNQAILQYFDRSLEILNRVDSAMNPAKSKSNSSGITDLFFGGFDFDQYRKMIKKNFGNTMVGASLSMMKTMQSMSSSFGEGPMRISKMLLEEAMTTLIPKAIKTSIRSLDKNFNRYIQSALMNIGDMSTDMSKGGFARFLGEVFGVKRTKVTNVNMGAYHKDAQSWNGVAQKTLVEVIPSYLAKIESQLTKSNARYYDHDVGLFKTKNDIAKEYKSDRQLRVQAGMSDSVDKLMSYLEKKEDISSTQIENIQKQVNSLVNKRLSGELSFNQTYKDNISGALSNTLTKSEFREVIMALEHDLSETIDSINYNNRKIESSEEGSVYRNLFNTLGKKQNRFDKNENIFGLRGNIGTGIHAEDIRAYTAAITEQMLRAQHRGASEEEIQKIIAAENRKYQNKSAAKNKLRQVSERTPWANRGRPITSFVDTVNNKLFDASMGVKYNPNAVNTTPPEDVGKASSRADPKGNRVKITLRQNTVADKTIDKFKHFDYKKTLEQNRSELEKDVQDTGYLMDSERRDNQKIKSNVGRNVSRLKGHVALTPTGTNPNKATSRADTEGTGATEAASVGAIKDQTRSLKTMVISLYTSFLKPMVGGIFGKHGLVKDIFSNENIHKAVLTLKDKLFNEKDGPLKDFANGFKDSVDYMKYVFTGKGYTNRKGKSFADKENDSIFGYLKQGYQAAFTNTMKFLFNDEYKENPWFKKYFSWMDLEERKKKKAAKAGAQDQNETALLGLESPVPTTETSENKVSSNTKSSQKLLALPGKVGTVNIPTMDETGKSTNVEYDVDDTNGIQSAMQRNVALATVSVGEKITSSGTQLTETLVGKAGASKEDIEKSYIKKFKENLPKMVAAGIAGAGFSLATGGHLGLVGSLFLPGGPVGGAIVGMGLQLLTKSESFQKFMFGTYDEKENKKVGGLISQRMQNSLKKALPVMVGGAVLGGAKHLLAGGLSGGFTAPLGILLNTMLPGGIIGGALVGMASSLVWHNEKFRNILFGEADDNGKRRNGILSKAYNAFGNKQAKANKMIRGGLAGLGIGAISGLVLSKMGILGAAVSFGGPIGMGIAGLGLGIASQTKRFQELLFGTEEIGPDGKPTGKKNRDGLLSQVRNLLVVNVFDPVKKKMSDTMVNFAIWAKKEIMFPFRLAFGPVLDALTGLKDSIGDFVKEKISVLTDGIGVALKNVIKTIFSPLTKTMGFIGRTLISAVATTTKIALAPVTGTLKVLSAIASPRRAMEERAFKKKYSEAKDQYLGDKWSEEDESGKYSGPFGEMRRAFAHMSDRRELSKNRDFEDAARLQYAETLGIHGKNHFGWRNVTVEKRELKEREKQEKADQKKWDKIYKKRSEYASLDAGKEFPWSPKLLKERQEAFAKLGVDPNKIKSERDIKDFIYRIDDWRDRYESKSEASINDGPLSLETEDMKKARIKTSAYQDNVQKTLTAIKDIMQGKGNERAVEINRAKSEASQKKYLTRLQKRLRKRGMSLNDVGIDSSNYIDYMDMPDWQWDEYRESENYQSGDFAGWYRSNVNRWTEDEDAPSAEAKIDGIDFDSDNMYRLKHQGAAQASGKTLKNIYERAKNNRGRKGETYTVEEFISNFVDLSDGADTNNQDSAKIKNNSDRMAEAFTATLVRNDERAASTATVAEAVLQLKDFIVSGEANAGVESKLDVLNTLESGGEYKSTPNNKVNTKVTSAISRSSIDNAVVSEDETATKTANKISGFFNNIFKRDKKQKQEDTDHAKEAEESKLARMLGDKESNAGINEDHKDENESVSNEKVKKKSLFEKITSGIGGAFSGLLGWLTDSSTLTKLGVGAIFTSIFHKQIGEIWKNTLGPSLSKFFLETTPAAIESAGKYLSTHQDAVAGAIISAGSFIGNLITAVGPALITGLATNVASLMKYIIPAVGKIVGSVVTTVWDLAKNKLGLGRGEETEVGPEEAAALQASGVNVRKTADGKFIKPGSRTYYDEDGEAQSISSDIRSERLIFNSIKNPAVAEKAARVAFGVSTMGLNHVIPGGKTMTDVVGKGTGAVANATRAGINNFNASTAANGVVNTVSNAKSNIGAAYNLARESGSSKVGAILKTPGVLKETGTSIFSNANTRNATSAASRSVADSAGTRFKSWLTGFFGKLSEAFSSPKMSKLMKECEKLGCKIGINDFIGKIKSVIEKAVTKFSPEDVVKASGRVADATAGALAKGGSKFIPVVGWVLIGYDAVSGALEAPKLFNINPDAVDGKMRFISSLIKTLLGLGIGPLIDIIVTLCSEFSGIDLKKDLATAIYDLMTAGDEPVRRLKAAQEVLDLERENYNEANHTNLSTAAYTDLKNQPWYKKLWNNVTGKGNADFSQYEVGNYRTTTSTTSTSTTTYVGANGGPTRSSMGYGPAGNKVGSRIRKTCPPVGYGEASAVPMAGFTQNDSRWSDYNLGSLPSGKESNMGIGGCGPTALSNVATALKGEVVDPLTVAKMAKHSGYLAEGGSSSNLFESGARDLGLKSSSVVKGNLAKALSSGDPVIVSGKTNGTGNAPYTSAGHIITASGLDRYGNTVVNDPMQNGPQLYNVNDLESGMTSGWSFNRHNVGYGKLRKKKSSPIGYGTRLDYITEGYNVQRDPFKPRSSSSPSATTTTTEWTKDDEYVLQNMMPVPPSSKNFTAAFGGPLYDAQLVNKLSQKASIIQLSKDLSVPHMVLKVMYDLGIPFTKIVKNGVIYAWKFPVDVKVAKLLSYAESNNLWEIPAFYAAMPQSYIPLMYFENKDICNSKPAFMEIYNNRSKYIVKNDKKTKNNAISIENAKMLLEKSAFGGLVTDVSNLDNLIYQGAIFFSQLNPKWADKAYKSRTIGNNGSDLVSLAMALSTMNGTKALISPDLLADSWITQNPKWADSKNGINWKNIIDPSNGIQNNSRAYDANGKPLQFEAFNNPNESTIKNNIIRNIRNRMPTILTGYRYIDSPFGNDGKYSVNDFNKSGAPSQTVLATAASDNYVAISDPVNNPYPSKPTLVPITSFLTKLGRGKTLPIASAYSVKDSGGSGVSSEDFSGYEVADDMALNDTGGSWDSALMTLGGNIMMAGGNFLKSLITGTPYESIHDMRLKDNTYNKDGTGVGYGYVNPFSYFLFGMDGQSGDPNQTASQPQGNVSTGGTQYSTSAGDPKAYVANFDHPNKSNGDFIRKLIPGALKTKNKYSIMPSLTLAQAIEESGWGRSKLATIGNNLFGIKASKDWNGQTVTMNGNEYDAKKKAYTNYTPMRWRKYSSVDESLEDHGKFLSTNRYAPIRAAKTYKEANALVQKTGYCTSPAMASHLDTLTEQWGLASVNNQTISYGRGKRGIGYGPADSATSTMGNAINAISNTVNTNTKNPLDSLSSMLGEFSTNGTAYSATLMGQDYETAKASLRNGNTDTGSSSTTPSGYSGAVINGPSTSSVVEWFKKTLSAKITSNYGTRKDPVTGKSAFHRGIDFGGNGSPIKDKGIPSPVAGKVVLNSKNNSYGNYVIVDDNTGKYHLFAHMDKPSDLPVGTKVSKGSIVGLVGSTGRSTGPHLHYEVRYGTKNGQTINPAGINLQSSSGYGIGPNIDDTIDKALSQQFNINTLASKTSPLSVTSNGIGGPSNDDILNNLTVAVNTTKVEDKLDILIGVMEAIYRKDQTPNNTNIISYGNTSGKKKSTPPVVVNTQNDNSSSDGTRSSLRSIHQMIAKGVRR